MYKYKNRFQTANSKNLVSMIERDYVNNSLNFLISAFFFFTFESFPNLEINTTNNLIQKPNLSTPNFIELYRKILIPKFSNNSKRTNEPQQFPQKSSILIFILSSRRVSSNRLFLDTQFQNSTVSDSQIWN